MYSINYKSKWLGYSLAFLIISFTGCSFFIAEIDNDSNIIEEKLNSENPQKLAQKNVEYYIKNKFGSKLIYKGYNFGKIYRLKKKEQLELDTLYFKQANEAIKFGRNSKKYDSIVVSYDTVIAKKKREIISKNIKPDYIISHVFTTMNEDNSGTVYEYEFILNDELKVKDLRLKMGADLDKDDFEWFYYFFQKYPLYSTGNYDKDIAMSNELYDYYNTRLSQLTNNKEEFLKTALRVTRIIHKVKKYDRDIICGFLVMKRIDEQKYCANYRPIKFSNSEEINIKNGSKDSLIGYKIFHKFSCQPDSTKPQIKAIYSELDPYFMPVGIIAVEEPFDKYFDK